MLNEVPALLHMLCSFGIGWLFGLGQVDHHLRMVGEAPMNIFALGDCNNVPETKLGFLARAQAEVGRLPHHLSARGRLAGSLIELMGCADTLACF